MKTLLRPMNAPHEDVIGYLGKPVFCLRCNKVHPVLRPQATYQPDSLPTQLRDLLPEIIGSLAVLALIGLAFWLWLGIAAAVQ